MKDENFETQETELAQADDAKAETPEGPADLDFYTKTIETLRKERDEFYDMLLRKQAEFENYRRRVIKEKEESRISAQADFALELLTVVDACEKGLATLDATTSNSEFHPYREGYELLLRQLLSLLEKFGVVQIPAVGEQFDPNIHEAMVRELTNDHEEGEILEEYRKGYMIRDRLLRPAQVKVAARPAEDAGA